MKIEVLGTIFKRKDEDVAIKMSYDKNQKAIAKFTVAEPRKFGRSETDKLDFWEVSAFGKNAEFVEKNFSEGKPIYIHGDAYHSKSNDKTYMNIAASEVDFVPKEYTGGTQTQPTADPQQAIQPQTQAQQAPQPVQPAQTPPPQAQPVIQQPVQQQAPQQASQPAPQPAQTQAAPGGFAPPAGFDPFA